MSTSVMTRRRKTHLDPIATNVAPPTHRKSSLSVLSAVSSRPYISLLSPRLAAAHAYYQENDSTPTSAKANSSQRRKSLLETEQFPRRHSTAASPEGALTSHFANFTFASTKDKQKLAPVLESEAAKSGAASANGEKTVTPQEVKVEDVVMKDTKTKSVLKTPAIKILDTTATFTPQNTPIRPNHTPIFPPQIRRRSASDVPYEYIHTRLRDWGRVYLLNVSSADVFINPIALRRSSVSPAPDSEASETKTKVNIRARVVPKSKERKPFVIHQKFDVEDFRAKIPISSSSGKETSKTPRLRRSNRHKSFAQGGERHKRGKGLGSLSGAGPFALHEEYALHFLPILAALLFSSHVCKGDLIDLPIPHPGAWEEVLKWVYTGGNASEESEEVRENVAFLGGDVV
ncbi:hypothetical protein HYALB_00003743 [Hymenoscyphus albidus]|uniref:Uncharacterized protein n=1 Tax=Hymenoscyphus albidus TaxID=595503 RepID=A0A9N9LW59_9HELO|nr:hypothetical protein HYALB_00003743 [Hymenoscyphus albidus]